MRWWKIGIIVLILGAPVSTLSHRTSANDRTHRKLGMEVPIYFVGDRRPKNLNIGDHYPDQLIGAQNISYGIIKVPICLLEFRESCEETREKLGWKSLESSNDPKSVRSYIKKQLQASHSIAMNYGASGGNLSPFKTYCFQDEFLRSFRNYVAASESKRFILFVHGCCITPEESFLRAAQLAAHTKLPILMFDWATVGKFQAPLFFELNSYRRSERALEISQHNFHELLSSLSNSMSDSSCIIIGHSMGNRLICADLLRRISSLDFQIEQLHLVRPDLSLPGFILDERSISALAKRVYIYVSDHDPNLKTAEFLSAGVPRLGRPGKFFDLAMRLGMTFDQPENRYYLNISALKLKHCIPFDLLSHVIRSGPNVSDESFSMKPWSSEHTRSQMIMVHPRSNSH